MSIEELKDAFGNAHDEATESTGGYYSERLTSCSKMWILFLPEVDKYTEAKDAEIARLKSEIESLNKEWKEELDNVRGGYQQRMEDMREEQTNNY